jgi:hypothetical protein
MTKQCMRSGCEGTAQVRVSTAAGIREMCLNHAEESLQQQREAWQNKGPINTEKVPGGLRKRRAGRSNADH